MAQENTYVFTDQLQKREKRKQFCRGEGLERTKRKKLKLSKLQTDQHDKEKSEQRRKVLLLLKR